MTIDSETGPVANPSKTTIFTWGYYGWGNHTPQLVEAVGALEAGEENFAHAARGDGHQEGVPPEPERLERPQTLAGLPLAHGMKSALIQHPKTTHRTNQGCRQRSVWRCFPVWKTGLT